MPFDDFNTAQPDPAIEAEIDDLLQELTLEEKVHMMSGHGFHYFFTQVDDRQFGQRAYAAGSGCERLGIEPLYFSDGPRGVRHKEATTCFPVPMARAATFDLDLEERIGRAMGVEARALGVTLSGTICINLLRHPGWGRAQETYGEDPFQLGEFGAALCRGVQSHNVIATVKHFAVNSVENTRFRIDVSVDERTLREVYLPHFKRTLDAGCGSVMSAYNKMNGDYCAHNRMLLTDILKDDWGFNGFVHSDWVLGVHGPDAVEAGLDIENPEGVKFGKRLVTAVNDGEVSQKSVDEAVRRILRTQLRFAREPDPQDYSQDHLACEEHVALALEAAEKSIVLLKNEDVLPFDREALSSLAVIGQLADVENLGDKGSSRVTPPYSVTILEGLRRLVSEDVEILFDDGADHDRAVALAQRADAVLCVKGFTWREEGEFIPGDEALEDDSPDALSTSGGDRPNLRLRPHHEDLIAKIGASHPRVAVALVGGSAIMKDAWQDEVGAIAMTWYSGMKGGTAIARVLFGERVPSGKLPFTVPRHEDHLPFFDPAALEIEYGPLHGYTKLDAEGIEAAYPFGFGLSYTQFEYGPARVVHSGDDIVVEAEVTNTGSLRADEVAQCYVGFPGSEVGRPVKLLRGFERLTLEPGASATVSFTLTPRDLAYYDIASKSWRIENIRHAFYVAGSSRTQADQSAHLDAPAHWPDLSFPA
ncbi:glycoside hydrolase family 3 N-terminal domain-containing protein [Citromicrobium bathyomarinum]